VTDVDTPHTGRRIEQTITLAIVNIYPVTLVQQGALVPAYLGDIIPGMNE
jgi:hypothetical protein